MPLLRTLQLPLERAKRWKHVIIFFFFEKRGDGEIVQFSGHRLVNKTFNLRRNIISIIGRCLGHLYLFSSSLLQARSERSRRPRAKTESLHTKTLNTHCVRPSRGLVMSFHSTITLDPCDTDPVPKLAWVEVPAPRARPGEKLGSSLKYS